VGGQKQIPRETYKKKKNLEGKEAEEIVRGLEVGLVWNQWGNGRETTLGNNKLKIEKGPTTGSGGGWTTSRGRRYGGGRYPERGERILHILNKEYFLRRKRKETGPGRNTAWGRGWGHT